jgi:hypothetical protein
MKIISSLLWFPSVYSFNSYWSWSLNGTNIYGNIPRPRNYMNHPEVQSACSNTEYGSMFGFNCPHMLMFSDDMIFAAKYDNNFNSFHYAVAGSSSDLECGKCYQIKLLEAENTDRLPRKQLIIQIINSGYDVNRNQFDLFMAGGGFGYYTACNVDCHSMYCLGGPCSDYMYKSQFDDWLKLKGKSTPLCYSGNNYNLDLSNHTLVYELCMNLVKDITRVMDNMTIDSCYRSYVENYHQNFVKTNYVQVQCPEGLYRLTGLRRQDDLKYSLPHPSNQLTEKCEGNSQENRFCITTMQDCCKPSCAWNFKGFPSQIWPKVDTCDKNGLIFYY